ncbi:MAG: DEAD/DEAH box helicase, partial [Chloroflexales bacterium]|nr:DEAD/DEAH box helicase [Chloroflexales bacterium]
MKPRGGAAIHPGGAPLVFLFRRRNDILNFADQNLHATLLENVRAQGYTTPTPIQAAAIPPALEGRDVIGLAQTGTGKTAAFVLPILQRLMTSKGSGTRCLIVTPTRELAEQIHDTILALGKGTGLRSATVYGGVGMDQQERALRSGADIIVACPGRLLDHIDRGYAKLSRLEVLVLDEADRMLDMGFLPAIKRILAHLPAKRQTLLFSATMPTEIKSLATNTTQRAATIQIGTVVPASTVAHAIYPVAQHLKTALLLELLTRTDTGSVLVFTRTKHRASRLAEQLARSGYKVAALHSNKSQNQRQAALDGFRDGSFHVLVATDIAARGIDVARVSHVITYDSPDTTDAYIHRIGRTGRAERSGDAFTMTTDEDVPTVRAIERVLGQPLERRTLDGFDYSAPAPAHQPNGGRPAR